MRIVHIAGDLHRLEVSPGQIATPTAAQVAEAIVREIVTARFPYLQPEEPYHLDYRLPRGVEPEDARQAVERIAVPAALELVATVNPIDMVGIIRLVFTRHGPDTFEPPDSPDEPDEAA